MKIYVVCLFVLLYSLSIRSQTKVSMDEQYKMIKLIEQKASSIKSLHCEFNQEKQLALLNHTLSSNGTMDFAQPDKLRWQYNSPYKYTFVINGHHVMTKNEEHTNVIDASQSKLFKEITQIMVNSLTGKCLTNNQDFTVEMFVDKEQWIASLLPKKKALSSMFKLIKLYIDPSQSFVNRVDLIENTNDVTKIYLLNSNVNSPIDEAIFNFD